MKKKLFIAAAVTLLVALGMALWKSDQSSATKGQPDTAEQEDLSKSDTLPGFKSRRENPAPNADPDELKPLYPPLDLPEVVLKEGQGMEDLTPEQRAQIQEQQRQIADLIARTKTDRFEVILADLVKGLGLDSGQENELRAHFAAIQGEVVSGDLQAYGAMEMALRDGGLDEVLRGILSPEQWAEHEAAQERIQNERIEAATDNEMNHLASLLTLDEEQKAQVRQVLRKDAWQKEQQSLAGSAANEAHFANELRERMKSAEPDSNPLEMIIESRLAAGRDSVLDKLNGVLTPEQLQRYRESLLARDQDMARFQNSLDAFQKGSQGEEAQ